MEHGLKLEKENWTELLGKEHLRTRSCARCAGLLVGDWFYDLKNAGEYQVNVLRCVQCGYRVDPTIVANRACPAVVHVREERLKDQRSVNSEHWEDVAVFY
jgi:hypothetical protein